MSTRPQRARSHTKACDEAMEGPGQAPPVADSCAKKCKSNIATSVVLLRASVPLVCPLRYRLPPALSGEAGAVSFRYSVPFFFSAAMEVCRETEASRYNAWFNARDTAPGLLADPDARGRADRRPSASRVPAPERVKAQRRNRGRIF